MPTHPKDYNTTTAPADGDGQESSLRKVNKILNDAKAGTSPIAVSISSGGGSSDPGYSYFRSQTQSATKAAVKASATLLYGYKFINPNTAPVYVKLYDALSAGVTVGVTTPKLVIAVPAGDGTTPGMALAEPDGNAGAYFGTGLTIAAVTTLADAGSTAPGTAIHAEITYK